MNEKRMAMSTFEPARSAAFYVRSGVRTFLLLDFDGVINILQRTGLNERDLSTLFPVEKVENHPNPFYDEAANAALDRHDPFVRIEPTHYALGWSGEMVAGLSTLALRDDVQVIWLTTWREHMLDVCARIGLISARPMVYLPWGQVKDSPQWEKIDAAVTYFTAVNDTVPYGENVKVAWVDDQVIVSETIRENPLGDDLSFEQQCLIGPDPSSGLNRAEMADLTAFVGGH